MTAATLPQASSSSTQSIHILSVRQPHADEIIYGLKFCENRTWHTNYRGPLYIHASKWDDVPLAYNDSSGNRIRPSAGDGVTGAIIGCVHLYDIVTLNYLRWLHQCITDKSFRKQHKAELNGEDHDMFELLKNAKDECWQYVQGPACWIMTEPEPLSIPIKTGGKLGVWRMNVPVDQLATSPQ